MKNQENSLNYTNSVLVNANIEEAFKALTDNINKWWSTTENSASSVGDVFKVSFGEESYWRFQVLESNKYNKIVWECIESHQDHHLKGIDKEWLNFTLCWDLSPLDEQVNIHFLHKGLVTTGVCYEVCSSAWDFYILDSLKNYLEKGEGKVGLK